MKFAFVITLIVLGGLLNSPACSSSQRATEIRCGAAEEAKITEILERKTTPSAKVRALTLEVGPEFVACVLRSKAEVGSDGNP